MILKTHIIVGPPVFQNPAQRPFSLAPPRLRISHFPPDLVLTSTSKTPCFRIITSCISPARQLFDDEPQVSGEDGGDNVSFSETMLVVGGHESGSKERQSMWIQIKEIVKFTGPATGLWICGPLMSLIDTAVIGQGSSIEVAALRTVFSRSTVLLD